MVMVRGIGIEICTRALDGQNTQQSRVRELMKRVVYGREGYGDTGIDWLNGYGALVAVRSPELLSVRDLRRTPAEKGGALQAMLAQIPARARFLLAEANVALDAARYSYGRVKDIAEKGHDLQPYRDEIVDAQVKLTEQSARVDDAIARAEAGVRDRSRTLSFLSGVPSSLAVGRSFVRVRVPRGSICVH